MRFWPMVLISLFLISGLLGNQSSPQKDVGVPWAVMEWFPFYISEGAEKGTGRMDRLRQILVQELPEENFVDLQVDSTKVMRLWRMNKNVCSGMAMKTEEEEQWAYHTPLAFLVPHEFVLVTANGDIIETAPNKISLKTVLKNKKWRPLFLSERSYGAEIDKLIADQDIGEVGVYEFQSALKMVAKQRYDYTVEHRMTVEDFNRKNSSQENLTMKPFWEGKSPQILYFACTKNEWGRQKVEEVDKALQRVALSKEYKSAVESWMDPEILKKNQQALREFYLRRAHAWHTISDESLLDQ